jgi:hypothetical protein
MRILSILAIFILFTTSSFSDELETSRIELQAQKKLKIAQNLPLTNSESETFWNVYNNYQNELSRVSKQSFDLIRKFNSKNENNTMSDQDAENMLATFFRIEQEELQIKQSYLPEFKKVLPTRKVVLFYQLDNKIDSLIRCDIAKKLPLIKTN